MPTVFVVGGVRLVMVTLFSRSGLWSRTIGFTENTRTRGYMNSKTKKGTYDWAKPNELKPGMVSITDLLRKMSRFLVNQRPLVSKTWQRVTQ